MLDLYFFREQSRGDPTLAANTYISPTSESGPSVDNLTKNIYSQVGSLISAQVQCCGWVFLANAKD